MKNKLFILPMRNWNRFPATECGWHGKPFYPTYEELKFWISGGASIERTLFILPMRNWNWYFDIHESQRGSPFYPTYEELKLIVSVRRWKSMKIFLSYLWGIEIVLCLRRGGVRTTFLSYLWGIEIGMGNRCRRTGTHFLSYLWGIEIRSSGCQWLCFPSFYPTYEELKFQRGWRWPRKVRGLFILPMRNWNRI